jgi:uncharacterized membrane protein YgaE (UPF0421/DUF939 family)
MSAFARWLITPRATPLAVAAAWLIGNQMAYLSGLHEPWWYGLIAFIVIYGLWLLSERLLTRLLRQKTTT